MCPPVRAHWYHLANTIELVLDIDATWRIQLNFCFLRPTRVHNPNGKLIGSAVFAQLTAESPYILHWVPISPKIAPSRGGYRPHLMRGSLAHPSPHPKQHLDQFNHFYRAH